MRNCDCCAREYESNDLVVCSSLLGPISFAYCKQCLENNAEVKFMVDITIENVGIDSVSSDLFDLKVYHVGEYIKISDYIKLK